MINFETGKRKKVLISLTPLIDVVFILLVFFMLATSFTKWNSINLSSSEATDIVEMEKKGTLVQIVRTGVYKVNNTIMSIPQIEQLIETKLAQNSNHNILLQPSKGIPLQELVNLMKRFSKQVGSNISLAAEES